MTSVAKSPRTNPKTKDSHNLSNEEFVIRKRLPRSLPREPNDIYVTRKTPIKVEAKHSVEALLGSV